MSPVNLFWIVDFQLQFLFFCLCWAFVAARGLSLVAASQGYSSCVRASLIAVASVAARTLGWWASVVAVHGLGCSKACGSSWTPRPGIEPVSPMLAGGFLSAGLARKSSSFSFIMCFVINFTACKLKSHHAFVYIMVLVSQLTFCCVFEKYYLFSL